jgi:dTDP-4-dehydrorhamnose 3,5-epimerase and related enzymes
MPQRLIEGVHVKQQRLNTDERGFLMEIMRPDWDVFRKFGQVYVTSAYPGVVKAWHYHKNQWDNFVCVRGMMKVALYDDREGSPTKGAINEFIIGERNSHLIQIPPLVYHGFKCISTEEALIVNVPTEMYHYDQPDEFRLPPDTEEIPYDWGLAPGLKHG